MKTINSLVVIIIKVSIPFFWKIEAGRPTEAKIPSSKTLHQKYGDGSHFNPFLSGFFFSDVICYRYNIYLLIVAEVAEIQNNHKYFPQRDNFERINEVKLYLGIRSFGKPCVEFSSTSSS